MLPALLMLLDWAAGEAASPYTPVVHYHTLEGPSKKLRALVGTTKKPHSLSGPQNKIHELKGSS